MDRFPAAISVAQVHGGLPVRIDVKMRQSGPLYRFIPEVHGCDETVVHGEYVENFAVRKNIPFKIPDELVHSDSDPASIPPRLLPAVQHGRRTHPHCRVQ
jgi:hypothetical protein